MRYSSAYARNSRGRDLDLGDTRTSRTKSLHFEKVEKEERLPAGGMNERQRPQSGRALTA